MKYMITNGKEYISLIERPNTVLNVTDDMRYRVTTDIKEASYFRFASSDAFIDKYLKDSFSKWGKRKVSNKNYVVTTGIRYITESRKGSEVTADYSKAKIFKSLEDVQSYIAKHEGTFETFAVIDQNGNNVTLNGLEERKKFTNEQLQTLGVEHKTKRIVLKKDTRLKVFESGNHVCCYCGKELTENNFTVDHTLPLNRGGGNEISNYQLCCYRCNTLKSDYTDNEFVKRASTILSNRIMDDTTNDEINNTLIRSLFRNQLSTMLGDNLFNKIGESVWRI